MSVIEVNTEGFNEAIKSDSPVFVKYFANWCNPCKMMAPVVEKLAEANKGVAFLAVNVDNSPDLAQKAGLSGIPAVIMYKNGIELGRMIGFNSETALQTFIGKHFSPEVKPDAEQS